MVPALADAELGASFSMGRTAQGLLPDVAYTVRMVALNEANDTHHGTSLQC